MLELLPLKMGEDSEIGKGEELEYPWQKKNLR